MLSHVSRMHNSKPIVMIPSQELLISLCFNGYFVIKISLQVHIIIFEKAILIGAFLGFLGQHYQTHNNFVYPVSVV